MPATPSGPVTPTGPATPRPSSAVVLARPAGGNANGGAGEMDVFMVRRHVRSEFAPDVYVFPGGSITPADRDAETTPGLCAPAGEGPTALGTGLRVGALRELFEEAGVLLAYRRDVPLAIEPEARERFAAYRAELQGGTAALADVAAREGLRLATDALVYWAHWITPGALPRRFDTRFFLAEAPADQRPVHDDQEVTDGVWITPAAALARQAAGTFPMVFATIHQLRELAARGTLDAVRAHYAATEPATIQPLAMPAPGGGFLVKLPGDPGDPVRL